MAIQFNSLLGLRHQILLCEFIRQGQRECITKERTGTFGYTACFRLTCNFVIKVFTTGSGDVYLKRSCGAVFAVLSDVFQLFPPLHGE